MHDLLDGVLVLGYFVPCTILLLQPSIEVDLVVGEAFNVAHQVMHCCLHRLILHLHHEDTSERPDVSQGHEVGLPLVLYDSRAFLLVQT